MASRKHGAPSRPGKQAPGTAAPDAASADVGPAASVVALGASAGGLEAFEQFFRDTPVDTGMGFVLVQHLDPSHASMLVEILQRITRLPVVEAVDQMPVLPNRVHVIPPNREMSVSDGRLQLTVPAQTRGLRLPIDAFFRSLAEDLRERAVGIVLSGTGTDGTLGLRAIFGAGGRCLIQEPASAKFDSMPLSALKACPAAQVLPVAKMAQALLANGTHVFAGSVAAGLQPKPADLGKILALLRAGTGHDFSLYKKSTVGRRIERRMAQHDIAEAEAYARYVNEHPAELQALLRELLINVTSFFRDPEAFETLTRKVLPALLESKPEGEPLRIWVAGCATGEEVYSLAIVVREWMDETQRELKVQLYGTDLDDDAIKVARAGLYPPNIAQDVTPERLQRYFIKDAAGYRVKKGLRDMAVFAIQSVIKDPPFTRLDLLCCRNLLIYLEPELQNRLIPIFHYALKPGGVLFLSPSESVGAHADLFEVVDRKWKFYLAKAGPASTRKVLADKLSWVGGSTPAVVPGTADASRERHIAELAKQALLQQFAPAAVVTDLQGNILYVHGDTGDYLRPAPGHPTHNVVDMAREGLQLALREALRAAATQRSAGPTRAALLTGKGQGRQVIVSARALAEPDDAHAVLLVSFQAVDEVVPARPARKLRGRLSVEAQRCVELENELVSVKDSLRAMLEEQQISNEELKSTNEELQSTNEELQSSNEELETSKEELQSVNEELVTVNSELHTKVEQMATIQDDMKNLLDNLRLGMIFVDRHLSIRRFTRDATKVFRLAPTDIGRSLADIRGELVDCDLLADAQVVLDSLVPIERETRSASGAWYLTRIQPFRTVDDVIDGAVLTFADVTERVGAIAAHQARALAEAIVDAVASPLVVVDARRRVISANQAYHTQFPGDAASAVGAAFLELGQGRWNRPELRQLLEQPWPETPGPQVRQIELALPGTDNSTSAWRLDVRRIAAQPADREVLLLSIVPLDTVPR